MAWTMRYKQYRQTSNIIRTLIGNTFVDHSDVVGAAPVGAAAPNYIFILDYLTPGFNGLGKDNCKTRRETLKFLDTVRLILEVWRYFIFLSISIKYALLAWSSDIKR